MPRSRKRTAPEEAGEPTPPIDPASLLTDEELLWDKIKHEVPLELWQNIAKQGRLRPEDVLHLSTLNHTLRQTMHGLRNVGDRTMTIRKRPTQEQLESLACFIISWHQTFNIRLIFGHATGGGCSILPSLDTSIDIGRGQTITFGELIKLLKRGCYIKICIANTAAYEGYPGHENIKSLIQQGVTPLFWGLDTHERKVSQIISAFEENVKFDLRTNFEELTSWTHLYDDTLGINYLSQFLNKVDIWFRFSGDRDVSFLRNITDLTLQAKGEDGSPRINGLFECSKLTHLDLSNCTVSVDALPPNLDVLQLYKCTLESTDGKDESRKTEDGFPKLKGIRYISVRDMDLSDIESVPTGCEVLEIKGCDVPDSYAPFKGLTSFEYVPFNDVRKTAPRGDDRWRNRDRTRSMFSFGRKIKVANQLEQIIDDLKTVENVRIGNFYKRERFQEPTLDVRDMPGYKIWNLLPMDQRTDDAFESCFAGLLEGKRARIHTSGGITQVVSDP